MALITRKVQGGVPERLRRFVAENLEALEPGLNVLETSLCLGHSTVDVVAVDGKQTLVLVAVAEVADAGMLISTLDAYIWCLAFPDNVRRLYPDADIAATRPPRVVFVATQMPGAFLDLIERLSVINPECHELAVVPEGEDAPSVGATAEPMVELPLAVTEAALMDGEVEGVASAARLSAGFDAAVARQWETFQPGNGQTNGHIALELPDSEPEAPIRAATSKAGNGQGLVAHAAEALLAQTIRAAEPAPLEHAAVNLGMCPRPEAQGPALRTAAGVPLDELATPITAAEPKPATSRSALEETRTVNHPALQALRFPKTGVSRQWQEFLDQLAANQ